MKFKSVFTSIIFFLSIGSLIAQVPVLYVCRNGTISFFSETPVENIDANSTSLNCIINTTTNEINYMVDIKSFKFKKALMQEHFNEKYLESDKYPVAIFKGKINEQIDWTKNGVYDVSATGKLNIHNVEKNYAEKGTLTIKDTVITIEGGLNIKTADHNIQIPTIVVANIAEVIYVKHKSSLTPYIPKKK
jgi:hypothetical protein